MAEDLLERVRREIHERRQTARAAYEESRRLEQALVALGSSGSSARDCDGAPPRRPARPRRPRATPGREPFELSAAVSRAPPAPHAPGVVDRAVDGTPLYAPRGELPREIDGSAVQCHLCGRWYRDLASSHLPRAHQVSAIEYRQLVGLRPRHPLQAPARSAAQGELLRRRITGEPRLRAAMEVGATLARGGELQSLAERALRERPAALERQRQLAASGSRLGTRRAAVFRARRERQARTLGYQGLEDFYRRRYREQRARLEDLAVELGCGESAVRGDLGRLRLGPDRARSHGARWS